MPLQREDAETVRDSILAVSGKLDRRMGGPGFRLFQYTVVNVAAYQPLDTYGPETWRRAIYRQAARSISDDLLSSFDCPECSQREARRASTTTALQALAMLNGKFVVQQAGFFAERVASETSAQAAIAGDVSGPAAGTEPASGVARRTQSDAEVARAFELALGRPPNRDELAGARTLVAESGLPSLCLALFNANEFLYY